MAVVKDKSLREALKMDDATWTGLWDQMDQDHDGQVTEKELYEYILSRHQVLYAMDVWEYQSLACQQGKTSKTSKTSTSSRVSTTTTTSSKSASSTAKPTEEELIRRYTTALFKRLDKDRSGKLAFSEVVATWTCVDSHTHCMQPCRLCWLLQRMKHSART